MQNAPAPKPFAINQQYKVNMVEEEAEGEAGGQDMEPSSEPPKKKRRGNKHPKTAKTKGTSAKQVASESGWDYGAQKSQFIKALKADGISQSDASDKWNESAEKRAILGPLTIGELKRRRFLPKEATSNPWAA